MGQDAARGGSLEPGPPGRSGTRTAQRLRRGREEPEDGPWCWPGISTPCTPDDWDREWAGTDRADPFAGHVVDGEIWARGATDQKAGVCSIIEAVRAVDRAGYRLAGPLTGVLVCDEESGQPGSGLSVGMRAAVSHLFDSPGPVPEFAIYTEPTTGAIYTRPDGVS